MAGEDGHSRTEDGHSRTIVIIDDDDDIRDALRLLFEFEQFDVVAEAANSVEGIAHAMRFQPGFVILDYMMPRLNGADTAKIINAVSPGSRIVAFSAVLSERPEWSDAYLNKERIGQVAPLLEGLIETVGRTGSSTVEA